MCCLLLSYHAAFITVEYSDSISVKSQESITFVAFGCHNDIKVVSSVYVCGNVYKAVLLLAGISLHTGAS